MRIRSFLKLKNLRVFTPVTFAKSDFRAISREKSFIVQTSNSLDYFLKSSVKVNKKKSENKVKIIDRMIAFRLSCLISENVRPLLSSSLPSLLLSDACSESLRTYLRSLLPTAVSSKGKKVFVGDQR
jgi:hypothetical protein